MSAATKSPPVHALDRTARIWPAVFALLFPFTPSALVNIVAGLSNISRQQFVLAVLLGKMIMIFTISFIGYDIVALVRQPLRTAGIATVVLLLWYAGKRVEADFR
ncbi:TVP38/TMEM64 family protein [Bacillus megaterium]|nr:TVP38/TMEM64 family protein [Priestia megaterium]